VNTHRIYNPASFWDQLHEQPRFRPVYPSEHVVRFLMQHFRPAMQSKKSLKIMDIGGGGGRHIHLLCELGLAAYGIDISLTGLRYTQARIAERRWNAGLAQASMVALPFQPATFDAVISYGVYYYGKQTDMRAAIQEVHRLLKKGGKAFVVLRTAADYRYGKGEPIEPDTFRISIRETNEEGTIQHFLREEAVFEYFSSFSRVDLEKAETTFLQRQAVNSDWLVTAEK
jgi:ubiquinone/menaquinone biosynthesis C-methylase UbiE